MVQLGDAYRNGFGKSVDKAKAENSYERAAKANDPAGMADFILESTISPYGQRDRTGCSGRATTATRIGQQELAVAKILGISGITKDEAGGVELARTAAMQGDVAAAVVLDKSYHHGLGVASSDAEAARWFCEAARLGSTRGRGEPAKYKLVPGAGWDPVIVYFSTEVAGLHPVRQMQAIVSSSNEAAVHDTNPLQQADSRAREANCRLGAAA